MLTGLVEHASGRTLVDLAQRWDELKGRQRGILGRIIFAIASMVFVVIGGLIVAAMT